MHLLTGLQRETEKLLLQLSKSHETSREACSVSQSYLEKEKGSYSCLMDRCNRLTAVVKVRGQIMQVGRELVSFFPFFLTHAYLLFATCSPTRSSPWLV